MSVTTSRRRAAGRGHRPVGSGVVAEPPVPPGREAAVPRRRRPTLAAAGMALVAAGGLGAAALVGQAGDRVEVLAVARTVPVGQTIAAEDLTVARVAADPALRPVAVRQRDQMVGRVAAVELRPGSLLTAGAVTDTAVPGPGEQVVGVAAGPGQLPARGLHPGDRVLVVPVPGEQAGTGGGEEPTGPVGVAGPARVLQVGPPDANSISTVDVLVGQEVGPRVAALASTGRVALILLPAEGE
jgi:hypothetical protein